MGTVPITSSSGIAVKASSTDPIVLLEDDKEPQQERQQHRPGLEALRVLGVA